jgi:putative glycosyltransferase (TIGR04372 family)
MKYIYGMNPSVRCIGWVKKQARDIRRGGRGIFWQKVRWALNLRPCRFLLVPLITPVALILRLMGIRFSTGSMSSRIGHLIAEPLYMDLLKRHGPRNHRHFVMMVPSGSAANNSVLPALPDHFTVVGNELLAALCVPLQQHPLTSVNMEHAIATSTAAADIYKYTHLIDDSNPFLDIPQRPSDELGRLLTQLGLDDDQWFVCLHNREAGYSASDDELHDFRNGTLANFDSAIEFIKSLGGSVIRMGDPSMSRLAESPGVVDYAHSDWRSPRNDLVLASNCRFFLGSSSGAFVMSACQGIPVVAVNMAPLGACKIWGPRDIAVPKIYRWAESGETMSFPQIFESELADARTTVVFNEHGVYLEESSSNEILGAVQEMLLRLDGKYVGSSSEESRQQAFMQLFQPHNYSYWSKTRVSAQFLSKYEALLDSVPFGDGAN